MALTGDHYVGKFKGHTIELIRNNWAHSLCLCIDGVEADKQSCHFPRTIILRGTMEVAGRQCEVVARSIPRYVFWTIDTIEVNGEELPMIKTK